VPLYLGDTPRPVIDAPLPSQLWSVGETIELAGRLDDQDGAWRYLARLEPRDVTARRIAMSTTSHGRYRQDWLFVADHSIRRRCS
jgi:hypothetical protein